MDKCRKPAKRAKNGKSRGRCLRGKGHRGCHYGRPSCLFCAKSLPRAKKLCLPCHAAQMRSRRGDKPQNYQVLRRHHTFQCGCSGRLPSRYGVSNKFARAVSRRKRLGFLCRVSVILNTSVDAAQKFNHCPMDRNTPHALIRAMMEKPNCVRCCKPLIWIFKNKQTPHLHHSHSTGEIYGFTHPRCNTQALEDEVDRLRAILFAVIGK